MARAAVSKTAGREFEPHRSCQRTSRLNMNRFIGSTKQYVAETIAEMKKCSWPGRKELFESTILVTVAVVVMGGFIALIDALSRLLIHYITKI